METALTVNIGPFDQEGAARLASWSREGLVLGGNRVVLHGHPARFDPLPVFGIARGDEGRAPSSQAQLATP